MTTATKTRRKPESIINDAPKLHQSFEVGDVAHQGDLIIVRIAALPAGATIRGNRQLAEGTTQGSRHVLARGETYDCPREAVAAAIKAANGIIVGLQYVGPCFVSPAAPTENDLTHPEHGNHGFPAGAVCAVVYQRNLDSEEMEARVRD